MRYTKKRNGKNVIPLRNAVCGVGLPKWSIHKESDIQSFLSGDAVERFAELEDKIEQGTLIELPCKVGDTIYYINRNNNVIEEDVVKFFTFTKDGIKPILTRHNKKFWEFYEWDKTIFLTREEAEKRLKELQE